MASGAVSLGRAVGAGDGLRNTLVRLLGWRGLILQQDPPTWDRWTWIRRRLEGGPLRTLDAGSGSGAFSLYAAVRGNQVVGLSFDEAANALAARRAAGLGIAGVRFRSGDLRHLDRIAEELGTFDQIICLETIEHLQNDLKLVRDLAALLRPGGRLLLTTPFAAHAPLLGEMLSLEEDGGHVRWGYSRESLEALFDEAGLTIESEEYLSGFVSQQITNLARFLGRLAGARVAWGLTAPLRLLLPLDRPLTRLFGVPRLAIAVVAVKR